MKRRRCSAASVSSPEPVGDLEAGDIELDPLGDPRIARFGPGQSRHLDRVFDQECGPTLAQMGFDPFGQNPQHQIVPTVPLTDPDTDSARLGDQRRMSPTVASRSMPPAWRAKALWTVSNSGSVFRSQVSPRQSTSGRAATAASARISAVVSAMISA